MRRRRAAARAAVCSASRVSSRRLRRERPSRTRSGCPIGSISDPLLPIALVNKYHGMGCRFKEVDLTMFRDSASEFAVTVRRETPDERTEASRTHVLGECEIRGFPLWQKGSTCVFVKSAGPRADRRAPSIGVMALRNGPKPVATKRGGEDYLAWHKVTRLATALDCEGEFLARTKEHARLENEVWLTHRQMPRSASQSDHINGPCYGRGRFSSGEPGRRTPRRAS